MINMTQIRLAWRQPRAHSKCTRNTDFQLPWCRVFSSRQGKCCCQALFLFLKRTRIFSIQQLSFLIHVLILILFVKVVCTICQWLLQQTLTKELTRILSLRKAQSSHVPQCAPACRPVGPSTLSLSSDWAEPVWISSEPIWKVNACLHSSLSW